jgi:hypothetical protein
MTESRSLRRWSGVGLAASGVITALVGCGGAAHATAGGTIPIALREYHLTPAVIDARPGAVVFEIANDGRLPHNLVLTAPNGTSAAKSAPIPPGATVRLDATLSRGTYTLASTLLSDKALGVTGTLHVG